MASDTSAAPGFVAAFSQSSVGDTTPNVLGAWCDDGSGEMCVSLGLFSHTTKVLRLLDVGQKHMFWYERELPWKRSVNIPVCRNNC
jgi:hypothetical protein